LKTVVTVDNNYLMERNILNDRMLSTCPLRRLKSPASMNRRPIDTTLFCHTESFCMPNMS